MMKFSLHSEEIKFVCHLITVWGGISSVEDGFNSGSPLKVTHVCSICVIVVQRFQVCKRMGIGL